MLLEGLLLIIFHRQLLTNSEICKLDHLQPVLLSVVLSRIHSCSPSSKVVFLWPQSPSSHTVLISGRYCGSPLYLIAQNGAGTTYIWCLRTLLSGGTMLSSRSLLQDDSAVTFMYFSLYFFVICNSFTKSAYTSDP